MTDFELKRQLRAKELTDSFVNTDSAIALFQLKQKPAYAHVMFQSYNWFCERMNSNPEPYMYDMVHMITLSTGMCSEIIHQYRFRNPNEALAEYMFDTMNQNHLSTEDNYYGVSASTSDIIVIKSGKHMTALYVDSFGYVTLPNFGEKLLR